MLDGVLIVDKSSGPTSHDVVDSVRKILKTRKVGHTGTLDPAATGVLPLVLGKATKLSRYLTGTNKSYRATIHLGIVTDTLDAEGEVLASSPVEVGSQEITAVLEQFRGEIDQVPPMYSAKKHQGKRLYQLAREGIEVERPAKRINIFHLEIVEIDLPKVIVDVTCSAGTYIRVLADDIGKELGCGAHLSALRRTSVGLFNLEQSVSLEELADDTENAISRIIPLGKALVALPRIDLPQEVVTMLANGYQLTVADLRTLDTPDFAEDEVLALGVDGGDVVAVARTLMSSDAISNTRREKHAVKTERVFVR